MRYVEFISSYVPSLIIAHLLDPGDQGESYARSRCCCSQWGWAVSRAQACGADRGSRPPPLSFSHRTSSLPPLPCAAPPLPRYTCSPTLLHPVRVATHRHNASNPFA